jgi:diguanylate cyclase (GGDEF)-like protein
MGGEEFLVISPGANADAAKLLAEKLCGTIAETRFEVGTLMLRLTVSIGVAAMAAGIASWEALMSCSERALHLAKQFGRNRCMLHPLNVGAPKVRALSA